MKFTILLACVGLCLAGPTKEPPYAANDGATNMWEKVASCPAYGDAFKNGAQRNWDWIVSICQNSTSLWEGFEQVKKDIATNADNIDALNGRVNAVEGVANGAQSAANANSEALTNLENTVSANKAAADTALGALEARVAELESKLTALEDCCDANDGGDGGSTSKDNPSSTLPGPMCPHCPPSDGANGIGGTLVACLSNARDTCKYNEVCEGDYSEQEKRVGWKFGCKNTAACKDGSETGNDGITWKRFCCSGPECDSGAFWSSKLGSGGN